MICVLCGCAVRCGAGGTERFCDGGGGGGGGGGGREGWGCVRITKGME